ncbi:MAG: thermonuclease family protein [Chloroflexi bacterium]|nr:thermonuclease family protein [Chloroflexota bacterium]
MRWLLILMWTVGAVLIAACGGDEGEDAPARSTPQSTAPVNNEDAQEVQAAPASQGIDRPISVAPLPTPAKQVYTIQFGDTLSGIAARFGTTTGALVALNDLPDASLIVSGDQLIIRQDAAVLRPAAPRLSQLESVELLRVIDGDTIEVRQADGTEERVRYIGIDTPEIGEPLFDEATDQNTELLGQGDLFLQTDLTERDRFERLLRYVWVRQADGTFVFVNGTLVALGLASITTFPPDVAYVDLYQEAQDLAQGARLGVWAEPEQP